jgi:hypothetical protein
LQLTGLTDVFVGSPRNAGDASRSQALNSGGPTTSWLGFQGTENLDGGLHAQVARTSFINVDSGTPGRFAGDPFFSRGANVGLSGGFGTVTVGRALAPNVLPTVLAHPLRDSFSFAPLVLHMNLPLFNGTGWGATTPADTGWCQAIVYNTRPPWAVSAPTCTPSSVSCGRHRQADGLVGPRHAVVQRCVAQHLHPGL